MREAKVTAEWKDGYGWVMLFHFTDGIHERIAVDRAEALRIAHRAAPGSVVEFHGPRSAA